MTAAKTADMPALPDLPVREVLDDVLGALGRVGAAILVAPPGAGKTTLLPLALLTAPWRRDGRIILVEPRRLAARAAARRMAAMLGEEVGQTVGQRMRLDTKVSRRTAIEVVTEGVFTRMALDDPELNGIAVVLFDEFHERALDADFGLALTIEIRAALRADLRCVVMSATLDAVAVARLLGGAPVIESAGRAHGVEIRYAGRPAGEPIEDAMAATIRQVHGVETGSILAFLPGEAEIRRTVDRLSGQFETTTDILPLYGRLPAAEQDRAIRPAPAGRRKIVLATAIAETSITIDGVRIVVDGGLSRRPVFEPATGIARLETVRVSQAAADQRAGRAGRTEPGVAIRLWREAQTASLAAFDPPEICAADLSGLILDCLAWGVNDPLVLPFLDPPPAAAIAEARRLLDALDAIDDGGGLTRRGRQMRALGLPVRAAAMVVSAAEGGHDVALAARLALVIGEPGLGGSSPDLEERLRHFAAEGGSRARAAAALAARIAEQARGGRQASDLPAAPVTGVGDLLAAGFPDRLARQRGPRGRYVMVNGRGAVLDVSRPEAARLADSPFIVIADLTGQAGGHRVLAAAAIDRQTIEERFADTLVTETVTAFEHHSRSVRARQVRRIGRLVLGETPLPRPGGLEAARALAEGVAVLGLSQLPWSAEAGQLRARIGFLNRQIGDPWPDVGEAALLARLETWFVPFQHGVTTWQAIRPQGLAAGLMCLLPDGVRQDLDRLAPATFVAPTGTRLAVRYDSEAPMISVRVQELYGLRRHPAIAAGRLPLVVELLSPAGRPIQTTRDLPGFWAGSWAEVRADMRGRYPKHVWPDNPAEAEATRHTRRSDRRR